jgi:glycosyltransferase involved in cell wall biosynthesis
MKKILFIVHNLKFGGIQKITVELARKHASLGNEVHILCLEKGHSIDIDFECHQHVLNVKQFLKANPLLGIYYFFYKTILRYLLPGSEFYLSKAIFKPQILNLLNQLESDNKFDAIFIRGLRSIKRLWWLKRPDSVCSLHLPYQLKTSENRLLKPYYKWIGKCLFEGKLFFGVSDHIVLPLIHALKKENISTRNFKTIHNPCDIKRVKALSEEHQEVDAGKYILGVGRLTKQKRFDVLIKAFHRLNTRDYKLVILGEGNQRKELEKLINDLELTDSVIMPGFVSNPYPWYKRATLFVLSSDSEGFGNVIVEALACGIPVISTDCGPVNEILTGRLKAGLIPKGNDEMMAEKINDFLLNPVVPMAEDVEAFSFENVISEQLGLIAKF